MEASKPEAAGSRPVAARLLVAAALLAVVAANVALTWGRWGDVVTDVGRELDTALQLAQGRRLYQDVRSYYGPLAPYVNAALFRLFGASVEVLAVAGILTGALLAAVIYRSVRLFAGRAPALAGALAVLQVDVFVQLYVNNIFNFVIPYSYAATYGMVLAAASVFFLMRHVLQGRRRDLWLSTGLLAAVGLSKIEPMFACGAAHAAAVVGLLASRRVSFRALLAPYLAPAGVVAAVYTYFYINTGAALLHGNLFLKSNVTAGDYALRRSGLLEWRQSLTLLLVSAACLLACLAVAVIATRLAGARPPSSPVALALLLAMAAVTIAGVVLWLGTERQFRVVPLALLAAGGHAVWKARRGAIAPRDIAFVTLAAFGLGALARIVFHASAAHYGFYLLAPALLAFAVWLCSRLPEQVPIRSRRFAVALGCVWLAATAASHAMHTRRVARHVYGGSEPLHVGDARGRLPVPVPYAGTVDEAVRFLARQAPGSRVLVVPHGAGITFLAGLENVWGVHALLPPDVAGGYEDTRLIADLERQPPDFVVVTGADTSEYGRRGFGIDYAQALWQWIDGRYAPVQHWRSEYYQVTVLGRRR